MVKITCSLEFGILEYCPMDNKREIKKFKITYVRRCYVI